MIPTEGGGLAVVAKSRQVLANLSRDELVSQFSTWWRWGFLDRLFRNKEARRFRSGFLQSSSGKAYYITEAEREAISKWLAEEGVDVSLNELLDSSLTFGEYDEDAWDLPEIWVELSLGQQGKKTHMLQRGGFWGLLSGDSSHHAHAMPGENP